MSGFHSAERVVSTVGRILGPADGEGRVMAVQRRVISVGAATEIPATSPSSVELAAILGVTHPTVQQDLKAWRNWRWRERYLWLRLVEDRLCDDSRGCRSTATT